MRKPYKLPPLILHPFTGSRGPSKLADASRASLILQGLLPADDPAEELERRLLEGRYCEISMLFYLGKDLLRWTHQCVDSLARSGEASEGIMAESFAALLVENPPGNVLDKLRTWGVHEHKAIFSRALGLHALFATLPERESLTADFVRYYHRFADYMFACRQELFPFERLSPEEFHFELYASGEYSRMLETQWGSA
ncbi:MAG TPA: hypothetical protein PLA43_08980 [Bryobacteraceae bacterium]|nr:hypothetical protein [Bryobacteraceae bacterium]HPU72078.1 hypothetical protein [Bryobacteraceae bacterium]